MPIALYEELDRCPLSSMCLRGLETHTTADKPNVYITKSISVHVFDKRSCFLSDFPILQRPKRNVLFPSELRGGQKELIIGCVLLPYRCFLCLPPTLSLCLMSLPLTPPPLLCHGVGARE